jgi:plasmid maintenance system killer protein
MHFSHELAYLTFFISPANLSSLNSPNTNRFTKIKHNNSKAYQQFVINKLFICFSKPNNYGNGHAVINYIIVDQVG